MLAKRPFLQAKRALLKNPFKLDRVSFSTPEQVNSAIEVWGLPRQTSKKLALEGFCVVIPSPRQLLRSLGRVLENSL